MRIWTTRAALTSALALFGAACTAAGEPRTASPLASSPTPGKDSTSGSADASSPAPTGLATPRDYAQSCRRQAQICRVQDGAVPAELWRSMRFPKPGGRCPATVGKRLPAGLPFGGTAFGDGPVRLVLVGAEQKARTELDALRDGWRGKKSVWFADPSYQGPVLLRGMRLDAPGDVAFGESPDSLAVQIPPGPGVNVSDGYRHWPGSTWVREPGCYGLRADGLDFSISVVVDLRPADE
ncbi:hypothetical protein [Nonomuraea cavernae]|uniref:hypothetical protein n=1 Tax=Nonomuraea cavernae TaxID=2045107 RepID=UPI0034108AAF